MIKNILNNRVYNEKGFFTLDKENYFYSLLYHALIQKLDFSEDYRKRLINMNIENIKETASLEEFINILKKWMIANEYIMLKPNDESVIFNLNMVVYFEPLIYRENDTSKLKAKIEEIQKENNEHKKKIKELIDKINWIENSKTWKFTRPIRDIRKIFSRGK